MKPKLTKWTKDEISQRIIEITKEVMSRKTDLYAGQIANTTDQHEVKKLLDKMVLEADEEIKSKTAELIEEIKLSAFDS